MVVALLLGGVFVLKRVLGDSPFYGAKSMLQMLGGLRLGQGKAIMLVEVAGEVLVLFSPCLTCVAQELAPSVDEAPPEASELAEAE